MWLWVCFMGIIRTLMESIHALVALPKRIMASEPVKYFKDLSNSANPQSSHKWVNLLWGGGSFVCYWADHFIRLAKNKEYKFEILDYVFIAAMAGISSLTAILSKKASHLKGLQGSDTFQNQDAYDESDEDTPPPAEGLKNK